MLFYRATLPLSRQTLTFASGLIRTGRQEIGTPWRALNPGQQTLLVLVYLRRGEPFAQVGAGFGVSTTTCWRYVKEAVELLAERAPKLRLALRKAKRDGMAYVIIDGTLIPIDRIAGGSQFCNAGRGSTWPRLTLATGGSVVAKGLSAVLRSRFATISTVRRMFDHQL